MRLSDFFDRDKDGRLEFVVPFELIELMHCVEAGVLVAVEVIGTVAALITFCALVKLCLDFLLA